jgi:putative cell wall-binding protein
MAALLAGLPAPVGAAEPGCPQIERVDAADDAGRAAALSARLRPDGAGTVVLARVDDHADGLAGGPLAALLDAPLLLSDADRLSPATADEVRRLGATRVVLLGGTDALSAAVEADLRALGVETVERHAGADRFATAALVARAVAGAGGIEHVYLAAGWAAEPSRGWADAVAVSALAAAARRPVLLTTPGTLPATTGGALEELGARRVTLVGGPVAVAERVQQELADRGLATDRLAGADRYATSRVIADAALGEGAALDQVFLASGAGFADALAAGPAAARAGGVLLLAGEAPWPANPAVPYLRAHRAELAAVWLVGSPQRVPDGLCAALAPAPGGVAGPPLTAQPAPPELPRTRPPTRPGASVRFITPQGSGTRDGSTWANAARLPDLPRLVAAAGAGGEVWIHGELGPYRHSAQISLRAGGAPGRPVVVRGVAADGSDAAVPEIVGTRASPYNPGGEAGVEVFRLLSGANHLRFENLAFRDQGNGCFRIGEDVTDLEITGMVATNVRRFVENYVSGRATSATVRGLVITRTVIHGFSKGAIRLQYDSSGILIEDVFGDSERQDGDNFAIGVHLSGTVHEATLRRVTMVNSQETKPEGYWNGDGFAAERETRNLLFEDTYSGGHTDGGYDIKSTDATLIRPVAEGSKRNYRFWGTRILVRDCLGLAPWKRGGSGTQAQVHMTGGGSATVQGCTFSDDSPNTVVFEADEGSTLTVLGGTVRHHPSARPTRTESSARVIQG